MYLYTIRNNSNFFQTYYTKTAADPQNPHDNTYDFHFNNEIFKDATNYSMVNIIFIYF